MDVSLEDLDDDTGTLVIVPGADDSIELAGYPEPGQLKLSVPLYGHEARELIEVLEPLAARSED